MRRIPTPELDRVFTYTASSYATDTPDLIFSSLKEPDENIFSEASFIEIAKDPIVEQTLGLPFLIMRNDDNVLATTDFEHMVSILESAPTTDYVVWRTFDGIKTVRPANIFDNCSLPHKYVLGCHGCLSDRETKNHCLPKKAILYYGGADHTAGKDIDDLEKWEHRKFKIAGFTYISPLLTAPEHIAKRKRPLSEHDFTYVEDRSHMRSKAMVERRRRERFTKEECSRCFTRTQCYNYHSWRRTFCEGPYLYTEESATEHILNHVTIPFNNSQLRYLLNNSGELPKRYNRCKYVASFYMWNNELYFGIKRKTVPHATFTGFDSYKDAEQFMQKYSKNHNSYPRKSAYKSITKQLKAMLCILADHSYGPQRCSAFHGYCSYPALYIERDWNSLTQYYGQARGRYDWQSRRLRCIADAMIYDPDVSFLERTVSPHKHEHTY